MNYCFEENTWGERFIPEVNRTSFVSVSAASYYDEALEFDPGAENRLTIVIGSDSGLLYKYLYSRDIPYGSRIVLLEPADVHDTIKEECDHWLAQQPAREREFPVSILNAEHWKDQLFNKEDIPWFLAGEVNLSQSHCAITDHLNVYYPLYRASRATVEDRRHALFNSYSAKIFVKEQMANCVDNVARMRKDPAFGVDKVAVIMGGGPSLDLHLDWIIENRSRLFVIAVSRLCGKLDKLKLLPDVVVSMDPSALQYGAAKLGTQWKDTPLIHSYHAAHQLPQQWLGPRFYIGYRFPWGSPGDAGHDDGIEHHGPTVGHAATALAAGLGFSTILLSGIDLCLDAKGDSHTQGTPEAELLKLPGNYDVQVQTYIGKLAGTSLDFHRSIHSLDFLGKQINRDGDVLFNLNEHAALIPSIKHIHHNQVELPESRPVFDNSRFREQGISELATLRQAILEARKGLNLIREQCGKADQCLDQIYGKSGKPPKPVLHKRLDVLEVRMEKAAPAMLASVRYYMGPELAGLRKPSGFTNMGDSEMETWARNYYDVTNEGCRFYLRELKKALELISLREAELADKPDISYLLEAWKKQDTPGRLMKFLEKLQVTASAEQLAQLNRQSTVYLKSLHEKDKKHEERVSSSYGTINKTMQSLRYLRHNQCESDLSAYSGKLHDLEWPYGTISTYIRGTLAEITNAPDEAIRHYQQVIDDCAQQLNDGKETLESINKLIEDTLNNLTRIYLARQDGEAAISSLGMLSEITPQYIPSYANLLDMLGNHDAAVDLLGVYLENFTADWRAARQLARIHAKAGEEDARSRAQELAESIRETALGSKKAA